MQLTLTADWTQPTVDADRLAIAGYTAVIETVPAHDHNGPFTAFQYTVLRDHFEIVTTGACATRGAARLAVERTIAEHAETLSA
jgi:hypothetical protein